jgi:hypothetical protein
MSPKPAQVQDHIRLTAIFGILIAAIPKTIIQQRVGASSLDCSDGATMEAVSTITHIRALNLSHSAVGTVLSYIFYWWAAITALIIMKWREVSY